MVSQSKVQFVALHLDSGTLMLFCLGISAFMTRGGERIIQPPSFKISKQGCDVQSLTPFFMGAGS